MIDLFTIIFTALTLWWLIAKELPLLFGVLVPTSALRRRRFEWLFGVVVVVAYERADVDHTARSGKPEKFLKHKNID